MTKIWRLFHTVKYLRVRQVLYRLLYKSRLNLRNIRIEKSVRRRCMMPAQWPTYLEAPTQDGKHYTFLGESHVITNDWNPPLLSKLWLYNLHYLDVLNSQNQPPTPTLLNLIDDWIKLNPPMRGNGWEPYPISLRLINLVKWSSRQQNVPPFILNSMSQQATALMQQLEYHILGNHLFANGKALVFTAALLDSKNSKKWLEVGLKILDQECAEQFLPDGAHFELSPMYHSVLIWDLCDLILLSKVADLPSLKQRSLRWLQIVNQGIVWLRNMCHPDGEISFFNDAAFGMAPTSVQLRNFASQLGRDYQEDHDTTLFDKHNWTSVYLADSGYISVFHRRDNHKAFLDVAKVGPDYQAGHAHADCLSFELSLFGRRVFVNSGTSEYGDSKERHRQRSTSAHNTVEIDDTNSSDVWGGFRVAQRACPREINISTEDEKVYIAAKHDGYNRLPGKVDVKRSWTFQQHEITICDQLNGRYHRATSRLFCHPSLTVVAKSHNLLEISGIPGKRVTVLIDGAKKVSIRNSTWHPKFGTIIPNHCIEVELLNPILVTRIQWHTG